MSELLEYYRKGANFRVSVISSPIRGFWRFIVIMCPLSAHRNMLLCVEVVTKFASESLTASTSCCWYSETNIFCSFFFVFPDGLEHVSEIKLQKCIYIQDECLKRLSETKNLQKSLLQLKIISCGNVTDKGIIALHKLTYVNCWALLYHPTALGLCWLEGLMSDCFRCLWGCGMAGFGELTWLTTWELTTYQLCTVLCSSEAFRMCFVELWIWSNSELFQCYRELQTSTDGWWDELDFSLQEVIIKDFEILLQLLYRL